jgi:hypothetical protein
MGQYVNPSDMTKEKWLQNNGKLIKDLDLLIGWDFTSDYLPVCLVENPTFSAAVIAFDRRELDHFLRSPDPRPKWWYSVAKHRLREFME